MKESRSFKMDNNLLYNVITRQAGSVEKAWLEAVQNAIDAKASRINFEITDTGFKVSDNGVGMTKEEILKYFEVFGKSSKQENDLGEFGMGRGQIFAQGTTIWNTRNHGMIVDIQKMGLKYQIVKLSPKVDGTMIEVGFYTKQKYIHHKIRRLINWIKYVPVEVYINGKKINEPLECGFEEDKNAVIKLDLGHDRQVVYNRGIFLKDEYKGVGVIVVTKKNLKVNFARNDIIYDCPIWAQISKKIDDLIIGGLKDKEYLSSDNKKAIVELMTTNEKAKEVLGDKKVFKGNERFYSLTQIQKSGSYTVINRRDTRGVDEIQQKGMIALDNLLPDELNVGVIKRQFTDVLKDMKIVIDKSKIVNTNDLDDKLQNRFKELERFVQSISNRKVKIEECSHRGGWTNGSSLIVLNKELLEDEDWRDEIWPLVIHELSHNDNTEKTDLHGEQFDENFRMEIENKREEIARFLRGEFSKEESKEK